MKLMCYFLFLFDVLASYALVEKCGRNGYCRPKEDCFNVKKPLKWCSKRLGTVCCLNTGKSSKKCREFSKYVYRSDYGDVLMPQSVPQNISECHLEAIPLVVGGLKAHPKEFPHMVAIGFGTSLKTAEWICGGSLITQKYVLSAAHCAYNGDRGAAKFVRTGDLNLYQTCDESNAQEFTISKRVVHPRYKPPSHYNDIALFELSKPVVIDGYTRPACLQVLPDEFTYKKVIATGWGKLHYEDDKGSPDLMKVTFSLIDSRSCNSSFQEDINTQLLAKGIIDSQICAGEPKGGKDTCQGDSGGPLQILLQNPYCMYSIIGITSFGKFCGFANSPAIYTRISYYVPWIESVIWP